MSDPRSSVGAALAAARERLGTGEGAALEAQVLLCHRLQRNRAWLFAHADELLAPAECRDFDTLVTRRCRGEPIAYIIGSREFWSLDLRVDERVLIPRPDTECLVEQALARIAVDEDIDVLDAGTGSGAVAIAIAIERPRARVYASERSAGALAVAATNVARLAPGRVSLLCASWLDAVARASIDVIVSNPPYIDPADAHLGTGDVRFEPRSALVAGEQGLADLRLLVRHAVTRLRPGGWLLVEHGAEQGPAVRATFTAQGYREVVTCHDLADNPRVSAGRIRVSR